MESFEVKINIAAGKRGVFRLKYQQLLKRTLGIYTQAINIDTPSLVEDLQVHVSVYEPQGFKYFNVEEPGSSVVKVRPLPRYQINLSPLAAPGAHSNIKISSYQNRNSHYEDKAIWRLSHLYTRKDGLCIETGPRGPSQ